MEYGGLISKSAMSMNNSTEVLKKLSFGARNSELKRHVVESCERLWNDSNTVEYGWIALRKFIESFPTYPSRKDSRLVAEFLLQICLGLTYIQHGDCSYDQDHQYKGEQFKTNPNNLKMRCSGTSRDDFMDFEKRLTCILDRIHSSQTKSETNPTVVITFISKRHPELMTFLDNIETLHKQIYEEMRKFVGDHKPKSKKSLAYTSPKFIIKCSELLGQWVEVNGEKVVLADMINVKRVILQSVPPLWDQEDWQNFFDNPEITKNELDKLKEKRKKEKLKEKETIMNEKSATDNVQNRISTKNTLKKNGIDVIAQDTSKKLSRTLNDSDSDESNTNISSSKEVSSSIPKRSTNNLISVEHMNVIKKYVPKESIEFRCLSMREGCHLMADLPSITANDKNIHLLDVPNQFLMQSAHFFGTKLYRYPKNSTCTECFMPRIGMIKYLSINDSPVIIEMEIEKNWDRLDFVVLVLEGDVDIGMTILKSGSWMRLSQIQDTSIQVRAMSSILLYYFLKTDMMKTMIENFGINDIKEGFKNSGIIVRSNAEMANTLTSNDTVYFPLFHPLFDVNSSDQMKSFLQSLSLFLFDGKCPKDKFEFLLPLDLSSLTNKFCDRVEELIKKHIHKTLALVIIVNSPTGFEVIKSSRRLNSQGDPCILYYCNMNHPTIPTFNHLYSCCHFTLMNKGDIDKNKQFLPYRCQKLSDMDPYVRRSTLCDKRPKLGLKPDKSCDVLLPLSDNGPTNIQNRLGMNDNEKEVLTELNYPIESAVDGLGLANRMYLREKDVKDIKRGSLIGDAPLNVLLFG